MKLATVAILLGFAVNAPGLAVDSPAAAATSAAKAADAAKAATTTTTAAPPVSSDPYQWLEDVSGEKPLAWVRERNAESEKELGGEAFAKLEADILRIMDSDAKIPYVTKRGAWYYNFWKDAKSPRGLWRRTTLEEYRKADPKWETVLDVDALGKEE